MKLEKSRLGERLGSIKINEVQKVIQLESGGKNKSEGTPSHIQLIDEELIRDVQTQMAIILPIQNENIRLFEGVLSAIPHNCLIIVVSNSQHVRKPDRFRTEQEILNRFCLLAQRKAYIIHQKDPLIAWALKEAGYTKILDENELIRDGKSEGVIVGILLAKLLNKDYIGLVDTGNFIPGSIWEYVRIYAAGFSMSEAPYTMVRISCGYKGRFREGTRFFKKWSKMFSINNQFLNALVKRIKGFDSDIIQTSCAGEHAMTIKLAELLPFASGYAAETYELVYILEKFGRMRAEDGGEEGEVEIFQIEARNPHVHALREREPKILREMLLPSLSSIYHSFLCDEDLRERILRVLVNEGCLRRGGEPPPPLVYPPLKEVNFERFAEIVKPELSSYSVLGRGKY